ncbi:phage T7 F exclusion suppressor FxsA [Kingella potus]|uniref:Phage T7 F exclusion suppressor FxsA n=1 Tax=Kingella potus TaxID=265175 RepID=A0A377R0M5_9NEIS|nr:FxsA family protein [Kingella potus]STR00802.1 phage T7 F exclusion suppressor FxsA [Kingella potus]
MRYFGIGFLVFILLEIFSLIQAASRIGAFGTLALIILSAMAGLFMLRRFGLSGILLAGAAVRSGGQVSAYQLLWPVRYAVAALLLISPGFFSTLLAVLLMLPLKGGRASQTVHGGAAQFGGFAQARPNGDDDIIEGDFRTVDGSRPSEKPANRFIEDRSKD